MFVQVAPVMNTGNCTGWLPLWLPFVWPIQVRGPSRGVLRQCGHILRYGVLMEEIGVRELKGALSKTLRAVARGETVRVTLYGKPLADLVPAGQSAGSLHRLIREGRVTPPARRRPRSAPRMAEPKARTASELVLAERDAER